MNTASGIAPAENHPNVLAGMLKRIGSVAMGLVLMAAILFLAAGRLNWTWAWVYMGINVVSVIIIGAITMPTSPETVAERGEMKITKKWDQIVSGFCLLAMYVALPLVAGLNVRFSWARDLSVGWHAAGAVVLAVGLGLTAWAMIENTYFSTAVRIQSDRGQTVCSTGPYRFVRHPGYVGYILQAISPTFLLGSLWALIPGITAAALLIIRTSLEDRMLQAELPGYREFTQEVRYRLVPGVW